MPPLPPLGSTHRLWEASSLEEPRSGAGGRAASGALAFSGSSESFPTGQAGVSPGRCFRPDDLARGRACQMLGGSHVPLDDAEPRGPAPSGKAELPMPSRARPQLQGPKEGLPDWS